MSNDLYRLVYLSRNDIETTADTFMPEVDAILATSRLNNERVGVTGALMFNAGCFAQVLEGSHTAVQATFERIQCDERHADVRIMLFELVPERAFSNWAMAFMGQNDKDNARFASVSHKSGFNVASLNGHDIYDTLKANLLDAEPVARRTGQGGVSQHR